MRRWNTPHEDFKNVRPKPHSYFVLVTRSASNVHQKEFISALHDVQRKVFDEVRFDIADFGRENAQFRKCSASKSALLFPACRQAGLLLSFAEAKERRGANVGQAKERGNVHKRRKESSIVTLPQLVPQVFLLYLTDVSLFLRWFLITCATYFASLPTGIALYW